MSHIARSSRRERRKAQVRDEAGARDESGVSSAAPSPVVSWHGAAILLCEFGKESDRFDLLPPFARETERVLLSAEPPRTSATVARVTASIPFSIAGYAAP